MQNRMIVYFVLALVLIYACSDNNGATGPGNGTEPEAGTYLGFTDFPHAKTHAAWIAAWSVIEQDGNMAVVHFDDGIPWQEALDSTRYHENYNAELSQKESFVPIGHITYLAVTPISFSRDSLAGYRGAEGNEPLMPPWDTLTFDSQDVETAFTNHCEYLIYTFYPKYFAYAIEANMLADLSPESWSTFVTLAEFVYTNLKSKFPTLPIFITIQADCFHKDPGNQSAALGQVLPFSDFIAVSGYPFTTQSNPESLAADYFFELADLDPNKPFAIAETAWPAEDVTDPYYKFIPASDSTQLAYMDRLLSDADSLDAEFICWFFTRDYDDFWESDFKYMTDAGIYRLWRDTGVYDGQGNPRPALARWRGALESTPLKRYR
ncbi:MAG: hypothetical protein KAX38_08320 [Candidatus Krumholzibacteria bacterium]|nr:hypothetical protein [Candidatus Krumholzibacteria bacterium]